MKKYTTAFLLLFVSYVSEVNAQDYFEDASGNGFPVILNPTGGNFNIRVTPKDNSLKVNFFKFFSYKPIYSSKETYEKDTLFVTENFKLPHPPADKPKLPVEINSKGFGLSIKGKTEQNLGSLFAEGAFSPGTVLGGYFASRKIRVGDTDGKVTKIDNWLFSAQYAASSLRLFDATRAFDDMKIDTAFNGFSASIAFFQALSTGKKKNSNLIWGGSVEFAIKNNYSTLKTYEVKDYEVQITDPQTGNIRTIQFADEDGYGYSKNNYAVKKYVTLRPHINFIPSFLNYRVGVIFYPSYVIVEKSKPRTNFELAFHVLEKGSPVLSNLAVYFSLNDVFNGRDITDKTFTQRSFSVGIGASFNMFTGKQK